jgi:hypothetical protein
MTAKGLAQDPVLYVNGKKLSNEVQETILTVELKRTIEGSSTIILKARDPEKYLQRAGIFDQLAEAHLDGLAFVAVAFNKRTDEYEITFEDREMYDLKNDTRPVRKPRGDGPGQGFAAFVQEQCKRVCPHAGFINPERQVVQPRKPRTHQRKGPQGLYKIEGQTADPEQTQNINIALEVCDQLAAPPNARLAILVAGIGESGFHTNATDGVTGTHHGVWQSDIIPGGQVEQQARAFLLGGESFQGGGANKLAREGHAPGDIATKVEESGEPGEFYEKHRGDAEAIIAASAGKPTKSKSRKTVEPFAYELNQPSEKEEEPNTLKGIEKYAKQFGWRFFKVGNDFWLIHDEYLEKMGPTLIVSEKTKGIVAINWELDHNERKKTSTVTIECRAEMWTPEPGALIKFADSVGKEVAAGTWIVANIERRDTTDNATTIELTRPTKAVAEPADKTRTEAGKSSSIVKLPTAPAGNQQFQQGGQGAGQLKEDSVLYNCLFNARWISNQKYPYVWGGGHGLTFEPTGGSNAFGPNIGKPGYDCSGAVSAILGKAGLLDHPYDTTGLEFWGQSGQGKWMTVWVRSQPDGHTFIRFIVPASAGPENTGGKPEDFVFHSPGTIGGMGHESLTDGNWKPRPWPGL